MKRILLYAVALVATMTAGAQPAAGTWSVKPMAGMTVSNLVGKDSKGCDPKAPFVHMGITMDRGAEEEAIAQRHIVTVKRDDKHVDVRVIDDEIAIVLRQLELTALVGGNEAVNPFVATETYHRQADGSWKLISFVYTHILPENYQFRFLPE